MTATALTPVTLLTGYLGSGKTTLLNRVLRDPAFADCAVLVNEFGAVPIDHLLVRESSENIVVMANGCVCCSVAGDLVQALRDLYFKRAAGEIPAFRRAVIETTGLADPAPILHTLIEMPVVAARYALSGVVTTVDAEHGMATLDRHRESVKQAAVADRIVITKTDPCPRGRGRHPGSAPREAEPGRDHPSRGEWRRRCREALRYRALSLGWQCAGCETVVGRGGESGSEPIFRSVDSLAGNRPKNGVGPHGNQPGNGV